MKGISQLNSTLEAESARWFLWTPVCFATGVFFYFFLKNEPPWAIAFGCFLAAFAVVVIGQRSALKLALAGLFFWSSLGFLTTQIRTHNVAAPVIIKKLRFTTLHGWIEKVEVRRAGGSRIQLLVKETKSLIDKRFISGEGQLRVRISIRQKNAKLETGMFIKVKAVLQPPPGPVRPGGYDYARNLWFRGIGGVGYAVSTPQMDHGSEGSRPILLQIQSRVLRFREQLAAGIKNTIPGPYGALATALITGDRGNITEDDLKVLRAAGLAHILAISGLHMAIMAGTIYWLLRWVLAAFPVLALNLPVKNIAAYAAIIGGFLYLLVSGSAISTQRAFIMTAVMFIAIILNRPAVTLRNVALAALFILAVRPESLLDVGFQMSFAAAAALVAIYEMFTEARERRKMEGQVIPPPTIFPVQYLTGIASTTIIAGIAVAPLAAYHFHKISQFSLLGNILAMPLVGVIIMPMALLYFVLLPVGLEWMPLVVMEAGLKLLLEIARYVAGLPGAVKSVPQISSLSLFFMVAGGLWFIIWKHRWRYGGVLLIATGLLLTPFNRLPDILIDGEGKVVAARMENGLLVSPYQRAGRFALERWMKTYGDDRPLNSVRDRRRFRCDKNACALNMKGKSISFIRRPAALAEDCRRAEIIIAAFRVDRTCNAKGLLIDTTRLKKFGAHGLYLSPEGVRVETVAQQRGSRYWSRSEN